MFSLISSGAGVAGDVTFFEVVDDDLAFVEQISRRSVATMSWVQVMKWPWRRCEDVDA
jgi:hypothetical protein